MGAGGNERKAPRVQKEMPLPFLWWPRQSLPGALAPCALHLGSSPVLVRTCFPRRLCAAPPPLGSWGHLLCLPRRLPVLSCGSSASPAGLRKLRFQVSNWDRLSGLTCPGGPADQASHPPVLPGVSCLPGSSLPVLILQLLFQFLLGARL